MKPQPETKTCTVRREAQSAPTHPLPMADEQVRFTAFSIFQARLRADAPGDAVSDWLLAEHQLGEQPPRQPAAGVTSVAPVRQR